MLVKVVALALGVAHVVAVLDVHLLAVLLVEAVMLPRLQEAKPCSSTTTVRPRTMLPPLLTRRYNSSILFHIVV